MRVSCFPVLIFHCAALCFAQTGAAKKANLDSFELIWTTVRDRHPDPKLNGLDWQAIHDETRPRIAAAKSIGEVREILRSMLAKLGTSHYAIIPKDLYEPIRDTPQGNANPGITPILVDGKALVGSVDPGSPAAKAGIKTGMEIDSINGTAVESLTKLADTLGDQRAVVRRLNGPSGEAVKLDVVDASGEKKQIAVPRAEPEGRMVSFGNLPAMRLTFEAHKLPGGAGYIGFNEFLDPVTIMPKFEAAVRDFAKSRGIVLDLRGNPGGIGAMAMGIAGFFIDKEGQKLGEMQMRDATLKFVIFPRAETYEGKLAILVDSGSASTTEILAQGLQDLKRARIFGTRTAGAALPSDIIRLPNGDGFQYAQASYTSEKGKVLEGAGVTPDVEVRQTQAALLAGHDLVLEAAEEWILSNSR
ncbi:MAG: PDZ domain-containing protein [Acidobacteriota bacterium]|nr:PDZ domain-containing protein [Acidobacteriota bacterium]